MYNSHLTFEVVDRMVQQDPGATWLDEEVGVPSLATRTKPTPTPHLRV